jgi:hypothetical protein
VSGQLYPGRTDLRLGEPHRNLERSESVSAERDYGLDSRTSIPGRDNDSFPFVTPNLLSKGYLGLQVELPYSVVAGY